MHPFLIEGMSQALGFKSNRAQIQVIFCRHVFYDEACQKVEAQAQEIKIC
jgi:hypothetical protein